MKTNVIAWQCDAPMCTTTRNAGKGEVPEGITGTVSEDTGGAGVGKVEFYACSREHVGQAVNYALSTAWEEWNR